MRWARITNGRSGLHIAHHGRKYPLSAFTGRGGWAMYRGTELYVSGYLSDGHGTYALLLHPSDPHLGKVVPRSELIPL